MVQTAMFTSRLELSRRSVSGIAMRTEIRMRNGLASRSCRCTDWLRMVTLP